MNKVIYRLGDITFEAEFGNQKKAFEFIADTQDIFGETCCGVCKSPDIKFESREDKEGHKYYKMRCKACGAQFEFGQNRVGETLFSKRWDKENKRPMPNGGWFHWQGGTGAEHPSAQQQTSAQPTQADQLLLERWKKFCASDPSVDDFNEFCAKEWDNVPAHLKDRVRSGIRAHAQAANIVWDNGLGAYVPASSRETPF